MGALTREELDAAVADWHRKMGLDAPERVNTKAVPASFATPVGIDPRDRQLVTSIARGFAPTIQKQIDLAVSKAIAPLVARIEELEDRYKGVFQTSVSYRKGQQVTFDGSLWTACRATTAERPGSDGSTAWQLTVKRGRDAPGVTPRPVPAAAKDRNGSTPGVAEDRHD